jgi:hypothetical protein
LSVDASVSEERTFSIFKVEVALLGTGWILIGPEEGHKSMAEFFRRFQVTAD